MRALQGLLRDLERTLHRLGHPCVGAVGAQVAPGEPLGLSYRTAVAALEQAMATESGRRGSATWTSPEAGTPLGQLMEAQRRAVLAFELHRWTELRTSLTRFALLARSLTGDSHEALGVHVQRLLYALLVVLEDQGALTRERRQALEGLLCAPPSTGDASGVVSHLERQVADLTALLEQGGTADRDARLRLTLQWLESHLTHADPLTEATRRSGLALSSFRREFRRATGTPFAAWLRRRRAESAAQLLRTTSLPVKTIATQVGFKDSHHLIRVFREHFAQTPERYRLQGLQ